jgi:hypothetical protein
MELGRLTDQSAAIIDPFETAGFPPAAKLSWHRLQIELQKWE